MKETLRETFKGYVPEEVRYNKDTKRSEHIARGALLQRADAIISVGKGIRSFGRRDLREVVMCTATYHKVMFTLAPIETSYFVTYPVHFTIDYEPFTDAYWDDNSAFGTQLNGEEIKGKGKYLLRDGDLRYPSILSKGTAC